MVLECKGGVAVDTVADKEKYYWDIKLKTQHIILTLLFLILINLPLDLMADDEDFENMLFSTSVGFEVQLYKSEFDATIITLPISFSFYPTERLDINFEIPIIYLSQKSEDGLVVTQSGATRKRRGSTNSVTTVTQTTTTSSYKAGLGDINMTLGLTLIDNWNDINLRSTLYLKAPTGDSDSGLGTGTFEIGPGLALSKRFDSVLLFGEGSYIFQNTNNDYLGKNYINFLGGIGIYPDDQFYISIFGKGSTPRSETSDTQLEGRLKLTYIKSRRVSWDVYLSKGFTDPSPDYGGGIAFTYQF